MEEKEIHKEYIFFLIFLISTQMIDYLQEMKASHVEPSVQTFNLMISSFGKKGDTKTQVFQLPTF